MVLFTAVTTTIALFATPLLVNWLGEKPFGAFRVVNDGYGYLTLLELGLGGAVGPLLARAVAQDDEAALRETVAAGAWAYGKVSLATLAVGLAFTPVVPWLARDLQGADVVDLQVAWLVGLTSFLSLGLLPFRTVVEARQLGYVVNLLLTAQAIGVTLLSLGLARAGWGITGQAMALVGGSVGVQPRTGARGAPEPAGIAPRGGCRSDPTGDPPGPPLAQPAGPAHQPERTDQHPHRQHDRGRHPRHEAGHCRSTRRSGWPAWGRRSCKGSGARPGPRWPSCTGEASERRSTAGSWSSRG